MTQEKKETYFHQLFVGNETLLKKLEEPFARRAMKRKLRSGYDDILTQIDGYIKQRDRELAKLNDGDLNEVVRMERQIEVAEKDKAIILKLYKRLFSKEMKVLDEEED